MIIKFIKNNENALKIMLGVFTTIFGLWLMWLGDGKSFAQVIESVTNVACHVVLIFFAYKTISNKNYCDFWKILWSISVWLMLLLYIAYDLGAETTKFFISATGFNIATALMCLASGVREFYQKNKNINKI